MLHVIQQPLVVLLDIFARVVRANTQHDGSEPAEIAVPHIVRGQHRDIEAQLPQHVGNVVARAHDVADLQPLRNFYLDHAGALQRRLIVEESSEIGTRDQAVAIAVIAAIGVKPRAHSITSFLRSIGQFFEFGAR